VSDEIRPAPRAPDSRASAPAVSTIETLQSPFEALAEAIVYQQLTGKVAATILGRVVDLFRPKKFRRLTYLSTADERLRGAGLSRAKVAAFKDLARATLDGTVPRLPRSSEWTRRRSSPG